MTDRADIRHGDAVEIMASLAPASIDAVVTDPPYALTSGKRGGTGVASIDLDSPYGRARIGAGNGPGGFMGKAWDSEIPGVETWAEALRVMKPGAHLLAFGGTRTFHRLTVAIEDAGFEIRDCAAWLYGSGFPKSLDVSKAIDKAAGAEREVVGVTSTTGARRSQTLQEGGAGTSRVYHNADPKVNYATAAATDAARQWSGWGTALKPAWEPIIVARKPLVGTVAANVQAHGSGALNVDGCRIEAQGRPSRVAHGDDTAGKGTYGSNGPGGGSSAIGATDNGRWPANVVLDEEAAAILDAQSGTLTSGFMAAGTKREGIGYAGGMGREVARDTIADSGGASRFFYTAKASGGERHYAGKNSHPTVKPVDLMRWLCRLVTPPGGVVLDPFMGSGSTGVAALAEGFRFIGCDREAEYVETARRRILGPLFAK